MDKLPHSLFSTDTLPSQERFAAWREDMSVIFDVERVPSPPSGDEAFHATFELFYFGRSVLGGLSSSTGRYIRSRRKAARDGLDAILLQLFLEGGVQFGVGQRTTYADAGDIVVFDLAQPVDNINRSFRHITSMWPRVLLEEVVPNISSWHGLTLPKDRPATALLRQHMMTSFDLASRFSVNEGHRVEEATLSLAGAAMTGVELLDTSATALATKEMLTYQIKRHIRQNLGIADLSPERIARHFGISRRHLYHLMEPMGGISRYQLQLRLQRCLDDIRNPACATETVSEIAYRWGFKHPSTFNRNFRAAFGMTPGEARANEMNVSLPGTSPVRDGLSRQQKRVVSEHHQWFHAIGI
jgi:AraC-like DNA-binding protein